MSSPAGKNAVPAKSILPLTGALFRKIAGSQQSPNTLLGGHLVSETKQAFLREAAFMRR
jgi:hypothetical protein